MAEELILIVEDNEKSRRLLRDILQVKGYQTIESDSAEEGIQLARQSLPALVLMDIQLPGINGMEARKQLKADPVTQHIPERMSQMVRYLIWYSNRMRGD